MYLLVLIFPLLAFLQAIGGGFFFGRRLCNFFSLILILATTACS
jgi:hypoxanthine phosphoribosyltransferase